MAVSNPNDLDEIRKEVDALLKERGLRPNPEGRALSAGEQRKVTELVRQLIDSNFDKSWVDKLDRNLLPAVSATLREIMSCRSVSSVRELEELNPYFNPYSSTIVRDQ